MPILWQLNACILCLFTKFLCALRITPSGALMLTVDLILVIAIRAKSQRTAEGNLGL